MIIIIEGPDGAGKTTLVKKLLAEHPSATQVHFGAPASDKEAYDYYLVYAQAILDTSDTDLVLFDRSWYSDAVYGPIMRGRVEMSTIHIKLLEALAKQHGGAHVIYCTAPLNVLWRRCNVRGETYVTSKDTLEQLRATYETVMSECGLPVIRYDTSR